MQFSLRMRKNCKYLQEDLNSYNFISYSKLATTCIDPHGVTCLDVGDSITAGSAAGHPYGAYIHYANVTLGSNYVFYDVGLPDETAIGGRLRFLDELAAFKPKYVTIMYGANDMKNGRPQRDIIDDILWMAAQAKASGVTPIILLTPARESYATTATYLDQNLSSQAITSGYNVFNVYDIIDMIPNNGKYDDFNSTNYVDNVHPNQAANSMIGTEFARYFKELTSNAGKSPTQSFSSGERANNNAATSAVKIVIGFIGRGYESLKIESERISQYIHQICGMYSLFRN